MSSSPAALAGPPTSVNKRHLLSAWLPVLFCIAVIAVESTPYFGADHTSGPLRRLVEYFLGPVPQPRWEIVHHYIRKTGHFTGYGILSIAWFRAFWMTLRTRASSLRTPQRTSRLPIHALAMLGTFCVASADEFHQSFLPNRTGTPWDVLLDCTGALAVQLLLCISMQLSLRKARG